MSIKIKKEQVSKNKIKFAEKGYQQFQVVSILIAGIAVTILLDNVPVINNIEYQDRNINFALLLMFFIFCIHIIIAGSISIHIFNIYDILSSSNNSSHLADRLHKKCIKNMNFLINLFWISLPLFLLSTTIITIKRYKIINGSWKYGYIFILLISSILFIYNIWYNKKTLKNIVNKDLNKKMVV